MMDMNMYGMSPYMYSGYHQGSSKEDSQENKNKALIMDTPMPARTLMMTCSVQKLEEIKGKIHRELVVLKEVMSKAGDNVDEDDFMEVCAIVATSGMCEASDIKAVIAKITACTPQKGNAPKVWATKDRDVRMQAKTVQFLLNNLTSTVNGGWVREVIDSVTKMYKS